MKRYVAELVGTFVLVFGGCGSAVLAGDKIGFAGVSFAFGLSLLAMVYAIGPISGCHLNPAVTVGVLLSKKMQPRYAPGYLVAQVIGAMLAGRLTHGAMTEHKGDLGHAREVRRQQAGIVTEPP
jgi:aquaporin Z